MTQIEYLLLETTPSDPDTIVSGTGLLVASTMSAQFIRNGLSYDPEAFFVAPGRFAANGTSALFVVA